MRTRRSGSKKRGKLVLGATQEANKVVLARLAGMYKDRVLDPEFPVMGAWSEGGDAIVKEKGGLAFSPFWWGDWKTRDVMEKHPYEATWTSMPIPSIDRDPAKAALSVRQDTVSFMKVDTKYPEAVVKLLNLMYKNLIDRDTAQGKFHNYLLDNGIMAGYGLYNV